MRRLAIVTMLTMVKRIMIIARTIVANPVISNPRKRFLSVNTAVVSCARLTAEGVIVTIARSASIRCMSMIGNQETGCVLAVAGWSLSVVSSVRTRSM